MHNNYKKALLFFANSSAFCIDITACGNNFPRVIEMHIDRKTLLGGIGAGTIAGIFGAGGGLILVPLLTKSECIAEKDIFPTSVCIILPICLMTLLSLHNQVLASFPDIIPYLIGSTIGGFIAASRGKKIPTLLLHRVLGWMILWGGFRYLWS